jgi:hypothetical protein
LQENPPLGTKQVTVGGDKAYDTADFVAECRNLKVTPHVAQNLEVVCPLSEDHAGVRKSSLGLFARVKASPVDSHRLVAAREVPLTGACVELRIDKSALRGRVNGKRNSWRRSAISSQTSSRPRRVKSNVAVEKLILSKSTKIKSRQEALQSISSGRLDIFYPPNFGCSRRKASFSTATNNSNS